MKQIINRTLIGMLWLSLVFLPARLTMAQAALTE